ncbi:nitrate reductase NapE component [Paenibacillus sp. PvR133]|jgi:nitrate reductase NapE component|nr:nitrate reductase NapE component [Paenibacillus sp. PvR133]
MNKKKAWKIAGFSVLAIVLFYVFFAIVGYYQFISNVRP